jgi:hypothetical protein
MLPTSLFLFVSSNWYRYCLSYCDLQNHWQLLTRFRRFLVPVYLWGTVEMTANYFASLTKNLSFR